MAKKKMKNMEDLLIDLLLVKPQKDSRGKYYPVCTFSRHISLIDVKYYKKCERKACRHYAQFREDNRYSGSRNNG